MTLSKGNGIIEIPSNHSVDETVEKLKAILQAKGVTLFALVDHGGEAETAIVIRARREGAHRRRAVCELQWRR